MPRTTIQASFTSGELTPSLHKRVDLARYSTGLKLCRNFFVHAHGGISNRAGTEFVAEIKDSSNTAKLVPFSFNTSDTYVLEFGDSYMRVIRDGGQVLLSSTPAAWVTATAYSNGDHVENSGTNYYCHADHTSSATDEPGVGANWSDYWIALTGDIVEIKTPYSVSDVSSIKFVQSADIITVTHKNHPVADISRTGHDQWKFENVSFVPQIDAPTGLAVTATGTGSKTWKYKVTAVAEETLEESLPPTEVSTTNTDALDSTSYNTITWNAVTGAEKYYVYKEENGVYGFIGTTDELSFKDTGYGPDLSDTPPKARDPFNSAGNYPSTVTYYEQRRVFGATINDPQTIWFTQTGNFKNLSVSSPSKADDAITVKLDASQVNEVRHMVPLDSLITLTSGAEWKITSGDNAFSLTNLRRKPQGFRGSSDVPPLIIGNTVLYLLQKQSIVRDLAYSLTDDGYTGNDLSVLSEHLFTGHKIVSWAYAQEPYSVVWAVRDDGVLLGFTYMREHEVWGWHQHVTDGLFEDVTVVSEGSEDAVYLLVKRTINGQAKRYIERLHSRTFDSVEDCFFVDCGLTYDGAPTSTLSGLDHLEGETLVALCDGNVVSGLVVSSGTVTLPSSYSKIHIGLPYTADMETLEPPIDGTHGKRKSVPKVTVSVLDSRGLKGGPNENSLTEVKQRSNEPWGSPIALKTGDFEINLPASWQDKGSVYLRQDLPLPTTILAVMPEVAVGG